MNSVKEILDKLNEWLAWFENPGETLPPALVGESAVIGFNSHGFRSNRFICRFETEKVDFDVELLMNDKPGEEDAEAIVKLALIALHAPFDEKVKVRVADGLADYNGGTMADFLRLIDKVNTGALAHEQIIIP